MEAAYKNTSLSIERRVSDLLSMMTLREKAGQLCQVDGRIGPEKEITERYVGSILHILGDRADELQALALKTRLGIPLLFGIDAIHGHGFWPGATVFPTQLGLSCSWNPEMIRQVARITATEVVLTGIHWTFSPVMEVVRDLRWGRVDETFGEDPYLVSECGKAMVEGYQGEGIEAPDTILACAKHFAGYSDTQGGRDASEADLTKRKLLSLFLPCFEKAVKAGCETVMIAYQVIDGIPCSANAWLIREMLKERWGFEGFTVTDWDNIGHMHNLQKAAPSLEAAALRSLSAGVDMAMATPSFPDLVVSLVEKNKLPVEVIEAACRKILTVKFRLGLFDNRKLFSDKTRAKHEICCEKHRMVARESAYQSVVLLKNSDGLLPFSNRIKRIGVIGPNADDPYAQLGDWSSHPMVIGEETKKQPRENIVTVLDGIRARAGAEIDVEYLKGCDVLGEEEASPDEIREFAARMDVVVAVVGDTLPQIGERRDRADLDLSGDQELLLRTVDEKGVPLVVVLVNSKPLSIAWAAGHADAILEAWNPGMEGGAAVAGILFGDRNPQAKLSISFPYHVGQQPVYYNQLPGWHADKYVDMPPDPLFAFGFGLSYTTFTYKNMSLSSEKLGAGEELVVSVDVANTGSREGVEIAQLYVNDLYSTVSTPVKQLKGWRRVTLLPGETKRIDFRLPYEELWLIDEHLEKKVEAGRFEVMVGGSSREGDLLNAEFEVVE
ncbi:MAG: glycoside hydrolase family 3 C-terminal domain-containing protein [Spirochaetales bacterium]|nr:glycoside hydrolase family 3 C-terminal domain-containing protein [Spirochaetales bacterium]